MSEAARLVDEADRVASLRDFAEARRLLRQAAEIASDDASIWLKLAAMARAARDYRAALAATERALALGPFDFTALLMRASLLDQLGDPRAGECYGQALANRSPHLAVPEAMRAAIEHAETAYAAHVAVREQIMRRAMAAAERSATPDEAERIARFRSNALRTTRVYHSEPTHFHFPGLVEREFHPRSGFGWLAEIEAATDDIRAEFEAVASAERAELVPYVQYASHEALRQWQPLNHNRDWTAIHLWRNGERVEANARHCPRTMALLDQIDQPRIAGASPNAMFSLLAPGISIPSHTGVNNSRLVCHLPLVVPDGCWFRVGAERRHWRVGEAFVFDDTIEHEAANPSTELRVVLIVDLWHPGLSLVERDAVTHLLEVETSGAGGL